MYSHPNIAGSRNQLPQSNLTLPKSITKCKSEKMPPTMPIEDLNKRGVLK
jgi:hypothetical protein